MRYLRRAVTGNDAGNNAYIGFCFSEIFVQIRKILSRNAQNGEQKSVWKCLRGTPKDFPELFGAGKINCALLPYIIIPECSNVACLHHDILGLSFLTNLA